MSCTSSAPSIQILKEGEAVTARFVGLQSLTEEHSELLDQEFGSLASDPRKVTLDLVEVNYLTSLPMSKVIRLHRQLHSGGGSLTLVNLNPQVARAFKVTRLDKVLRIQDTHSQTLRV